MDHEKTLTYTYEFGDECHFEDFNFSQNVPDPIPEGYSIVYIFKFGSKCTFKNGKASQGKPEEDRD